MDNKIILEPTRVHTNLGIISLILAISIIAVLFVEGSDKGPNKSDITISNMLVRANQSNILTPLIAVLLSFFSYLVYLRKGFYVYSRIILLIVSFILVIMISPGKAGGNITIGNNKTDHYRIAGCIFISFYLFFSLTFYNFLKYCKKEYLILVFIFFIYLALGSLINLLVLDIFGEDSPENRTENTFFAINEYIYLLLILVSILYYSLV